MGVYDVAVQSAERHDVFFAASSCLSYLFGETGQGKSGTGLREQSYGCRWKFSCYLLESRVCYIHARRAAAELLEF